MNSVELIGRLTKKPELAYNQNGNSYCRLILAVNRPKKEDGTQDADFISCVAWKNTADTICKYLNKGSLIGLEGRIQTGSYDDKDGNKRYTTDVVADSVQFLESKGQRQESSDFGPTPYDYQDSTSGSVNVENDPFGDLGDSVTIDDNFLD